MQDLDLRSAIRTTASITLVVIMDVMNAAASSAQEATGGAGVLNFGGIPWEQYVSQKRGTFFNMASLTSGTYSKKAALSLAEAAKLSYADGPTIDKQAREWGFSGAKFLNSGGTQAFIALSERVLLIAFRGTTDLADWIDNLTLTSTARPYGKTHTGFLGSFQRVEQNVRAAVAKAGNRVVWFTGHSLGGAIATATAAEMKDDLPRAGIVTFGQPQVGFGDLKTFVDDAFGGRYQRYVNANDPVASIPPWPWQHVNLLRHVGVRAGGDKGAAKGPTAMTPEEFEEFRREVRRLDTGLKRSGKSARNLKGLRLKGRVRWISDHYLDNYIAAIERHK